MPEVCALKSIGDNYDSAVAAVPYGAPSIVIEELEAVVAVELNRFSRLVDEFDGSYDIFLVSVPLGERADSVESLLDRVSGTPSDLTCTATVVGTVLRAGR